MEGLKVVFDVWQRVVCEVKVFGTWRAVQFADATQYSIRRNQSPDKRVLVVGLCIMNKVLPMVFTILLRIQNGVRCGNVFE